MSPRAWLGLLRSLVIYYGRPGRQRALARFYAGLLRPGDLAFDIGAHVGNRTRALRAAGARVVAVEPQQPFAGFLRRTLPRDVTLVEAAAGPVETQAEMAVSQLHPTVSSLAPGFADQAGAAPGFGHVRWEARQSVRVTTLEALIAAHGLPAFVKVDVEGFEVEVLRGLAQPVALIAVEYLPALPEPARQAVAWLAAFAPYRFNVVEGEADRFLWPDWRSGPAALDWLAARDPSDRSGDLYARLEASVPMGSGKSGRCGLSDDPPAPLP